MENGICSELCYLFKMDNATRGSGSVERLQLKYVQLEYGVGSLIVLIQLLFIGHITLFVYPGVVGECVFELFVFRVLS